MGGKKRWRHLQTKIRGGGPALPLYDVRRNVDKLLRDTAVSMRAAAVAAKQPGDDHDRKHCYYLRDPPSKKLNVDHVLECQLVGFAVLQAKETHEILKNFDLGKKYLKDEPFVVQNLLAVVYEVQNSMLNLRIVDDSVNKSKGQVFKTYVATLEDGQFTEDGIVRVLSNTFSRPDLAVRKLLKDVDKCDDLAKKIGREMLDVEDAFTAALWKTAEEKDAKARTEKDRTAAAVFGAIADNIVRLYDVMELTRAH